MNDLRIVTWVKNVASSKMWLMTVSPIPMTFAYGCPLLVPVTSRKLRGHLYVCAKYCLAAYLVQIAYQKAMFLQYITLPIRPLSYAAISKRNYSLIKSSRAISRVKWLNDEKIVSRTISVLVIRV
jgi:hypothetical protein